MIKTLGFRSRMMVTGIIGSTGIGDDFEKSILIKVNRVQAIVIY